MPARPHVFDLGTDYCMYCGQSKALVEDGKWYIDCPGGGNVTGVSHIIADRVFGKLLEQIASGKGDQCNDVD